MDLEEQHNKEREVNKRKIMGGDRKGRQKRKKTERKGRECELEKSLTVEGGDEVDGRYKT